MNEKYSITTAKILGFTDKPKSLNVDSIRVADKNLFTTVIIPNSVSSVSPWSFSNCSPLASVHIPNSVSSIEHEVFWNCSSLVSVHIPNSIESVDYRAFGNCPLASIYIPNSISTIDYGLSIIAMSLVLSIYLPLFLLSATTRSRIAQPSLLSISRTPRLLSALGLSMVALTSIRLASPLTQILKLCLTTPSF